MRQRIRIRERLPIWGLRLVLGAILLTLSELVMWANPPAHSLLDWPALLILYVALAAIVIDITVRLQAHDVASLLLVSGVYGLLSSSIINHSAFASLPYSLVVQGLALQTGAGLIGLLVFVTVMRGKTIGPIQVAAAAVEGALWGIWVHWYPLRTSANWGLVPIETATLYILPALVVAGLLVIGVAPRFRFFREKQMELLWWEAIVAGAPLFIALVVGMFQELIPFLWLVVLIVVGAYMVWALSYHRHGYEPSILAEMTFAAPNPITYIVLSVAFLIAGTLAYNLVTDANSPIGIGLYLILLACGFVWLPGASLLVFWRAFRKQTASVEEERDG